MWWKQQAPQEQIVYPQHLQACNWQHNGDIHNYSYLIARILEKSNECVLKWVGGKWWEGVFDQNWKRRVLGYDSICWCMCNHKCEEGQFTVATDFVFPYDDATWEENINGSLDGKFETMIYNFCKRYFSAIKLRVVLSCNSSWKSDKSNKDLLSLLFFKLLWISIIISLMAY